MNLAEARTALAAAVSTLDGVTCTARPVRSNLRLGDAYVTIGRVTPGQFLGSTSVVLSAFVNLGSDEATADAKVEELSIPLLECADALYPAGAAVEAQAVSAGDGVPGVIYQLALSVTLELSE